MIFRDKGRETEKERERDKHQCEIEIWISCLPHVPDWGWGLNLRSRYVP